MTLGMKIKFPRDGGRIGKKSGWWAFFILFLVGIAHAGSHDEILKVNCPNLVTCRYETVSRDFTCLEFKDDHPPCVIDGMAGGEHTSFITVTGTHGDTFRVHFIPTLGSPHYTIDGTGIKPLKTRTPNETEITMEGEASEFVISLSAHPYGEYRLVIEKLKS